MTDREKQFVDELSEKFGRNLSVIEYQFNNEYGWPEFDPLRDEISKCLICDLCQASITLTNHLLENFLKTMLIYHEAMALRNKENDVDLLEMYKPYVDKYDGLSLSQSLNRAKRIGLITKDHWKLLNGFRNDFRNAYSHAEKKKIFKDLTVGTNIVRLEKDKFNTSESVQTPLIDLPLGQGITQAILSKTIAFGYFISVDTIIRDVLDRFKKLKRHPHQNIDDDCGFNGYRVGKSEKEQSGHFRSEINMQLSSTDRNRFNTTLIRTIVDFIAGMTDSFAISQFNLLYKGESIKNY